MSAPPGSLITVVIVSFNTRALLLRCLDSLRADGAAGHVDVWVVDNDSTDGSLAAAQSHAPWATVVASEGNRGFGSAVNLVARRTGGEWLLVANADIALHAGALQAMLSAGHDPCVGCVAPRLVLPSGATQHSVHPFPTIPVSLLFNLGLHRLSPALADRLCLEGFWDSARPRPVPWAIGACLLLRRSAFDAVGHFDERQWMYAEDLDLEWRLHRSGWKIRYQPTAVVSHEAAAATAPAFGTGREARFMAATYVMLERRRGRWRAWATGAINIAGAVGRLAWMTPLSWISRRWRASSAANLHWLRAHVHGVRAIGRSSAT